jgi:glycosyltransferase involved in cell wall biosynthesis
VCFVAQQAYGALCGRPTAHSGGIERQSALWARWFAARGHDVRLLTWDDGQADAEVDGVRVVTMCRREAGLRGLRFFHPRWTSLTRALARADADVYACMCGDASLGQVALWCRLERRPLAYYVSSTDAVNPKLGHLAARERLLYRVGVRAAARVMVQTRLQQEMLREGFGVGAEVVPMPSEALTPSATPRDAPPAGARVLWVGRFHPEKRLEWLLDVAAASPELSFDVVGAANDASPYESAMLARARSLPNVRLHGRIAEREPLAELYRSAALLCCTSPVEGFPNTFLEAWSHGLPVVTTFDPDGLTERLGLGAAARDPAGIRAALQGLVSCADTYRRASESAWRYFHERHRPEIVLPRVERIFLDAAGR